MINDLESKAILQLLLFFLHHGRTKISDININASQTTIYRALTILARLELIDEERVRPFTRYIHLTGDGEAIAQKLEEIEQVLEAKKARQRRQAHS